MRTFFQLLPVVAISCFVACGGNVVAESAGTGATGTGAGTGTGGGGGGGLCPSSQPAEGSSCNIPTNYLCTYGDSVRPECRTAWSCSDGGSWLPTQSTCLSPPPGDCPGAQPTAQAVCPSQGDVCTYGDTICLCDACAEGPCMMPPPRWQCALPPSTAGCPPVAPNGGSACAIDGLTCTYGFVCANAGAQVECTFGAWKWSTDITCAG